MGTSYVKVKVGGPLFDGRAIGDVKEWADKTVKDVAEYAVKQLDAFEMDKTGRGTGRYQSEIRTTNLGDNSILIDDPLVYGPWLEGTSKRNEDTRFKGYRLWRKTRTRVRAAFKDYAQKNLDEYLAKMNGA